MIIDLILDRQDDENSIAAGYTHKKLFNGELVPLAYSPSEFYRRVREYETGFGFAPEICNFVNSVNWIS